MRNPGHDFCHRQNMFIPNYLRPDGVMRALAWVLLAGLLAGGCADKKEPGPVDPPDDETPDETGGDDNPVPPSIDLGFGATTLSLPQGGSGTVTVVITRKGGFDRGVSIGIENLPAGVEALPAAQVIAAHLTSASMTLTVAAGVTPGDYTITVRATSVGIAAKTATFTLTVTSVSDPGFTMTVLPAAFSIQQNGSATATITIARLGGFQAPVSLTVTGMPAGVNATIEPATYLDQPATITVGATYTAPVGTHTLTVRANALNSPEKTATLTVTVTSSNPTGNVLWPFCAASGIPLIFAYQDGAGPWTPVTPVNGIYAANLATGRGAVLYSVGSPAGVVNTFVYYGTATQLSQMGAELCGGGTTVKSVSGTVNGISALEQAWISMGGATAVLTQAGGNIFTLNNVLDGPRDLLATRVEVGANGVLTANRLILRRGLNPPNGGGLAPLDFNGAEAFGPVGAGLTLSNLGSDQTRLQAAYRTATGMMAPYYVDGPAVSGNVRVFPGIGDNRQLNDDLHVLTVVATPPVVTPSSTRSGTLIFRSAANKSITLGPDLGPVNTSVLATGPFVRLRAQWTLQIDYNTYWSLSYAQPNRTVTIGVTAAYLGTASGVDIAFPEVGAIFDPSLGPQQGVVTTWTFTASGWLFPNGTSQPPFMDGVHSLSASRSGIITP
jgi:hypothetical protein